MQLADRTFIVTGGASGLGGATVTRLCEHGANVVLLDRDTEAGEHKVQTLGECATFIATDVADENQVAAAIRQVKIAKGDIHGVLNCAGIVPASRMVNRDGEPHPLDKFNLAISVNLVGTFNVCRFALAEMINNHVGPGGERGVVINTASIAAMEGQIGQIAYAASKGGVLGMTLPMAREMARYGVRVVTLAPGVFDTPMMGAMPDSVRDSLSQQIPFPPRMGDPDEYALLACQIIENPYLNGEVIRLDGAFRMPG